jgi:hypothetical protein
MKYRSRKRLQGAVEIQRKIEENSFSLEFHNPVFS